jgi:hypothetical protein
VSEHARYALLVTLAALIAALILLSTPAHADDYEIATISGRKDDYQTLNPGDTYSSTVTLSDLEVSGWGRRVDFSTPQSGSFWFQLRVGVGVGLADPPQASYTASVVFSGSGQAVAEWNCCPWSSHTFSDSGGDDEPNLIIKEQGMSVSCAWNVQGSATLTSYSSSVTVKNTDNVSITIGVSWFISVDLRFETPEASPPPSVTLTVQLYRVDAGGSSLGPASSAQVSIDGTTYTADNDGKVSVTVSAGSTVSVEVLQTTLSSGWQRYTFWRWGDGSTQNPRSFTVSSSSTTVTAYVWDERLLKVTWEGPGAVTVNGTQVSNGWSNWYRYGSAAELRAAPGLGSFEKWMRGVNGGQLADYSTANPITVAVDNGYHFHAVFKPVVQLTQGTMYLPGEGIATPWLESADWAWNGTWLLNVTEPYSVKEHIVAILTDGSNVRVLDLLNGTSFKVYLPLGWKNNPFVKSMGQMKITRIPSDKNTLASTFPSVNVSGQTWYLVALAAWNPYKQFNEGYDTSCWLSNGTSLAVYNVTFTYTFKNGTKVVFKEPVVVSTLKVTATPVYSIGELKQGLSLKVTASWKYLPPARTGIQPSQPSSIVGVAVIGNTVYNGTLIEANSTSKTFLVKLADDTWTLYTQGVTSITASAYWLSSMGTPEGPVAMQEPAQLSVVYVMPHIDAISEGSSLTATISIFDVRTDQRYSADIYIELRDNRTFAFVAAYGPYRVPGQATITINRAGTKQYVLAIYALPIPQKDKLVVPIAAVYPPRA